MTDHRFLVTGANGCIGAWTVRHLVREGLPVVAFDRSSDRGRLALLLEDDEVAAVPWVQGDITDAAALDATIDEHAITSVIHLAALQVPFCREDPALGAAVNVVGTVNVLEAVRRRADRMGPVVYASSVAAHPQGGGHPGTLYGVFKQANEGTAVRYWADYGVPSVGLRPHTVYGPGRDQGLTAAPTLAMLSAAVGRRYTIPFSGRLTLHHGSEVAAAFVAAARAEVRDAVLSDLPGHGADVRDVVGLIERAAPGAAGLIDVEGDPLPFPGDTGSEALDGLVGGLPRLALEDGVRATIERFAELSARGLLQLPAAA